MGIRRLDLVERLAVLDSVVRRLPAAMRGAVQVRGGWKQHCPLKRIQPRGPETDVTVGQLKDSGDTAHLPNTPGSGAGDAFAIRCPNVGLPGDVIVADGPHSLSVYMVSGGKFWPEDDVLDWLIDNLSFHLQRHLGEGKSV